MRGRLVVVALLVVGVALAVVAAVMRGRNVPRLPLAPGSALLIVAQRGGFDLGPFAAEAVEFTNAHGVSSDRAASIAAIETGRMPRESGCVHAIDSIRHDVPTVPLLLAPLGFASACFESTTGTVGFHGSPPPEPPVDAEALSSRVADFFAQRGKAPTYAEFRIERDGAGVSAQLWRALSDESLRARLVVVAVALDDPQHPRLAIRLPRGLLPPHHESRDVSLLDVTPTLLETFGAPVERPLMEPFLLGPQTNAPRFFLFTEPLDARHDESLADCDAVRLRAAGRSYVVDPRATPNESSDDPRAIAELREFLYSAFGYRVETHDDHLVARFVGFASRR